jgi:hypothetical protein
MKKEEKHTETNIGYTERDQNDRENALDNNLGEGERDRDRLLNTEEGRKLLTGSDQ